MLSIFNNTDNSVTCNKRSIHIAIKKTIQNVYKILDVIDYDI